MCENPRALYNSHTQTFSKKTRQIDHRDSYVSYSAIISVNRAFTDAPSIVIDLSRKSIILEWKTGFKSIWARSNRLDKSISKKAKKKKIRLRDVLIYMDIKKKMCKLVKLVKMKLRTSLKRKKKIDFLKLSIIRSIIRYR